MDTPRYIVVQEQERPPFAVRDQEAAICGEVARCWTRQDAERIAALLNADGPATAQLAAEVGRLRSALSALMPLAEDEASYQAYRAEFDAAEALLAGTPIPCLCCGAPATQRITLTSVHSVEWFCDACAQRQRRRLEQYAVPYRACCCSEPEAAP